MIPLLELADERMRKIKGHHFVNDPTLLAKIASISGRSIAENAGFYFAFLI